MMLRNLIWKGAVNLAAPLSYPFIENTINKMLLERSERDGTIFDVSAKIQNGYGL